MDTNASTPHEEDYRMVAYDMRMVAYLAGYLRAYGPLMARLVARAAGSVEHFRY